MVTRDHAYAEAAKNVLPDYMWITNHFHLHQNLLDAVHKALGREIPAIDAVLIEGKSFVPDALLSGKIETIPKNILQIKQGRQEGDMERSRKTTKNVLKRYSCKSDTLELPMDTIESWIEEAFTIA